jgi:hypothetical protein
MRGAYSHKRPAHRSGLKLTRRTPDQPNMQMLVTSRRARALMDASGFAFALGLIALVSQSA